MSKNLLGGAGAGKETYYVLGIDIHEKKMGVPVWGWGAGIAAALYYMLKKKR